ncbi:hypothetical protein DWW54_08855 [Clostridium sp. AF15-6B]|nr:hypothetical protein DWW62_08600 [Clostridium sp. AF16-25]RGH04082.1 hypothetical protein DWW48_06955 [Clostridium sp. AF15-49]RGH07293.1 hypothetical protein DWW54_08855 [Clostridium sp. AF15-6B]
MPWWLIMIIVIVVALAIMFVLYRVGDKLQKKQSAQREQMVEAAQPMNMLIIDKKMLPMKDAGLPKMVMEQTPKRYQKAKLPIAKVKVGPQIMNMICDDAIFDELPTRGEVKAMVSGIYIISVKSVRGKKVAQEEETSKKKKKGNWRTRMRKRQVEMQKQLNAEMLEKAKSKGKDKPVEKSKEELRREKERAKKISDKM